MFGSNSLFFFLVAAFTAVILVFAANTAFNGFPVLAPILGQDGYLPRQFGRPGVMVVSVPWQLGSAEAALARRAERLPDEGAWASRRPH